MDVIPARGRWQFSSGAVDASRLLRMRPKQKAGVEIFFWIKVCANCSVKQMQSNAFAFVGADLVKLLGRKDISAKNGMRAVLIYSISGR